MGEPFRIRHGITFDPVFGYRAIRETNGDRVYLGPWTTEAQAQATADEATRITHEVIDAAGIEKSKGVTPLGVWTPTVAP